MFALVYLMIGMGVAVGSISIDSFGGGTVLYFLAVFAVALVWPVVLTAKLTKTYLFND